MRGLGGKFAAGAAVVALLFSAASAEPRHSGGFAAAKVQGYCVLCHGRGARGFLGYRPIPQLAGQQAQYIQIQLTAFAEGRRDRNLGFVRYARVHGMSAEKREAVAEYLSKLEPAPHGSPAGALVDAGERIFKSGAPDNDIPACAVCHGPEAKGDGIFPRLAGQWKPYIINTLTNWAKERGLGPNGDDNSQIMAPIAKSLTQKQIQQVAAYLSSLK
jgi:cytochrome c553